MSDKLPGRMYPDDDDKCLIGVLIVLLVLVVLATLLAVAGRISEPTLSPEEREAIRRSIDGWRVNDAADLTPKATRNTGAPSPHRCSTAG